MRQVLLTVLPTRAWMSAFQSECVSAHTLPRKVPPSAADEAAGLAAEASEAAGLAAALAEEASSTMLAITKSTAVPRAREAFVGAAVTSRATRLSEGDRLATPKLAAVPIVRDGVAVDAREAVVGANAQVASEVTAATLPPKASSAAVSRRTVPNTAAAQLHASPSMQDAGAQIPLRAEHFGPGP